MTLVTIIQDNPIEFSEFQSIKITDFFLNGQDLFMKISLDEAVILGGTSVPLIFPFKPEYIVANVSHVSINYKVQ